MTDVPDATGNLSTCGRWLAGILGIAALVMGVYATFEKDANSVGVGGIFLVGIILLLSALGGRLPASISLGKDTNVLFSAAQQGVRAGTASQAEVSKKTAKEVGEGLPQSLVSEFVEAKSEKEVRDLVDRLTDRINANISVPAAPEVNDIARQIVRL
ncbi:MULTISPECIES: hypothetical protein [Streptomyces]|uniref:hypothetical protein n=1 Tax=Streptomyces TaxID=1883 RepID=UPI000F4EEA73|nr:MULTISPECIES: hypothetical protein [Streptomyces]